MAASISRASKSILTNCVLREIVQAIFDRKFQAVSHRRRSSVTSERKRSQRVTGHTPRRQAFRPSNMSEMQAAGPPGFAREYWPVRTSLFLSRCAIVYSTQAWRYPC